MIITRGSRICLKYDGIRSYMLRDEIHDLKKYLRRSLLIKWTRRYANSSKFIILKKTKKPRSYDVEKQETVQLYSDSHSMVIEGESILALSHGIYLFLRKYIGIIWMWPGKYGEVVPFPKQVTLPESLYKTAPGFKMRHIPLESYKKVHIGWPDSQSGILGLHRKRWLLNSPYTLRGVHGAASYLPPKKYFKKHSEYYALVDGKRGGTIPGNSLKISRRRDRFNIIRTGGWQVCTSNSDVVERAVLWLKKRFRHSKCNEIINISPNDGLGFCNCEKCRELDPPGEHPDYPGSGLPNITDRIFSFFNNVADGVRNEFLNRKLSVLAYTIYRIPPCRIKKIAKNIIIFFCIGAHVFDRSEIREKGYDRIQKWLKVHPCGMGVYEYYMANHWPCLPHPIIGLISQSIKDYYSMGTRFFFAQSTSDFAVNAPNYYLASSLLWDPEENAEKVMDDFFVKGFGSAASQVKKYFEIMEEGWRTFVKTDVKGLPKDQYSKILRPDLALTDNIIAKAEQSLKRAYNLSEEKIIRKRLDFLKIGFDFTKLHLKCMHSIINIYCSVPWIFIKQNIIYNDVDQYFDVDKDNIWNFCMYTARYRPEIKDKAVALQLIQYALKLWKERRKFLNNIYHPFALDKRWIKMIDSHDESFPFCSVEKKLKKAAFHIKKNTS